MSAHSQPAPPRRQPDPRAIPPDSAIIPRIARDGVEDEHVRIAGEPFIRIRNVNRMEPFLMSVVSDSDLWLFVGSNTGLSAGRGNPDRAIFPYQTADKILRQPQAAGITSLIEADGALWEPWSQSTPADLITRDLYKHATGASVRFVETHHSLRLRFTWSLGTSAEFGLVRICHLENLSDSRRQLRLLDGWRHLLPPGVSQDAYARFSYLACAYMRHESLADLCLGIHTLNSGISDRAEPCESQRVSVAWTLGRRGAALFLSDRWIDDFRRGGGITPGNEARGDFGAHLAASRVELPPGAAHEWITVADIGLDHADVIRLRGRLREPESLRAALLASLAAGVRDLEKRIAGADAMQQTADRAASVHHFANVLFNCMRGGTFHDGCRYAADDFTAYLAARNAAMPRRHAGWLARLPARGPLGELEALAARSGDPQLVRLAREYLPLSFSRRHGDPSRPWNRFDIRTRDRDGRPLPGYSGNWRDIFQNWESLAHSYPEALGPMIAVFLNASTADGYNPYRITREGIDWEVPDPKDPWSHIGYWGDHQIVYLLRLLEAGERFQPGRLAAGLGERIFASACVPYEIRGFDDLARDPRRSISFNEDLHQRLAARAAAVGGDGKLLAGADGEPALVTLAEKLLVPVLVKLSNLVPGGGIWLNTQRPEWNDANNALAGWGLSVVTVCHIRRYLAFLQELFENTTCESLDLSAPVLRLLRELAACLPDAAGPMDAARRWRLAATLGRAGETHRAAVYQRRPFEPAAFAPAEALDFIRTAIRAVDATIDANRRADGMFHSYNVLDLTAEGAAVRHLDLMLEGQVAALGSGRVGGDEALVLLDALRRSPLYREDQDSYLLYPDRPVSSYLRRHLLPADWRERAPLLARAHEAGCPGLVTVDEEGGARFCADFSNARDLTARLDELAGDPAWADAVRAGSAAALDLWEAVFHHRAFTGRSGAMFAFEGLGSIYWHMVAKLLLAVQETLLRENDARPGGGTAARLAAAYRSIRNGLGFTRNAATYGAFPTDPYSHTPAGRGAQQPGMTGQVKEEILTRMGELGVRVRGGRIHFEPVLLARSEFFGAPHDFRYDTPEGAREVWSLGAGTLAFTLFQTPVCYELAREASITVERAGGGVARYRGSMLPEDESAGMIRRIGSIRRLRVAVPEDRVPLH